MDNGYKQFFKKAQKNAEGHSDIDLKSVMNENSKYKQLEKQRALNGNSTKKNLVKRSKKTNPLITLICLIGFGGALGGFYFLEDSDRILSHFEISFFGKAHAETPKENSKSEPNANSGTKDNATSKENPTHGKASEVATTSEKEKSEKSGKEIDPNGAKKSSENSESSASSSDSTAVIKKEYSEDELNHFARLSERKAELDKRESEIQKMELELTQQKTELEKRMKELEEMRKKISTVLEDKVQLDDKRVENLVQFYSNMKPQQAAKIIESIDESLAVEVLARMKKKNAAEIMNLLKPEKAQIISEKYAGYRK